MNMQGNIVAGWMFDLIQQEEKIYKEINAKLAQIDRQTNPKEIDELASKIVDHYQKSLNSIYIGQCLLLNKYKAMTNEEKINFMNTLQEKFSRVFGKERTIDITDPASKIKSLEQYFALLKDFNSEETSHAVNLYKLSAIKRMLYPAGVELIQKAITHLNNRALKIDDTKNNNPFATSPHNPNKSEAQTNEETKKEPTYIDAIGPYKGIYPYPVMEQNIDIEKANALYHQDPSNFANAAMNKESQGVYKVGTKKDNQANHIEEILVIIDPMKLQAQIGENKDGKLVFYSSPMHLAIHHEELHMVRGLRGAERGDKGLPKQLERVYHNVEEFLAITGAKSNERKLNDQMGLPLRVGHSGATIGMSPGDEWITNLVATQLIHDPKDLSNIDFSIYKWDMSGEYYESADFSNSNLTGINLEKANLQKANLSEANLENGYLPEADLSKANLTNTNLTSTDLRGAKLEEALFSGTILNYTQMPNAVLIKAKLTNIDSFEVNLEGANLQEADFTSARLKRGNLSGANLSGTIFENAILSGANLTGADLNGTIFRNASLDGVDLTTAKNLDKADFTYVDLNNVKLPQEYEYLKQKSTSQHNM